MGWIKGTVFGFAAFALLAGGAFAQDFDKDELKRQILKEVEQKLREQEERLLRELSKIIDEELDRLLRPDPARAGAEKGKPKREPGEEKSEENLRERIRKFLEKEERLGEKAPGEEKREEKKEVRPGFLGVGIDELMLYELEELEINGGVRINTIYEGSGAEKAGVREGDVLYLINGEEVKDLESLVQAIQKTGAGGTVKLGIIRDGERMTLEATLGERPEDPGPAPEEPPKEEPKEAPKEKPGENPLGRLFRLDEQSFDKLRKTMKSLGLDAEDYFEQDDEGYWRPNAEFDDAYRLFEKFRDFLENPEFPKFPIPGGKPAEKEETPPAEPWLGIQIEELDPVLRSHLGLDKDVGLLVAEVMEGSPAAKAGLKSNDILVRLDGKPVVGEATLADFMADAKVGQEAEAVVLRKGAEKKLKIVLGARGAGEEGPLPEPKEEEPAKRGWLGVQIDDLDDLLRSQLGLEEGLGLLVADVVPGGPAGEAGIVRNDILIELDGKLVKGEDVLADFMERAKAGQEVKIKVLRRGVERTFTVTLGEKE